MQSNFARLFFYIVTTLLAFRRKKVSYIPEFKEPYRQRFFGEPLHICFGCSHDNPHGLKLNFFRTDPKGLAFKWMPQQGFESFPNIIHGGISATLLDEVCGVTIQADLDLLALTVSSRVHYHAPVYKDRLVIAHARIIARYNRYILVQGELMDEKGKILSSMIALFFVPSKSTFHHVTKMNNVSEAMASYVDFRAK